MKYPPIPRLIRATGGAVRVRVRPNVRHEDGTACWGLWDDSKRIISIDTRATREHQWRTLFHELGEVAIRDSGVENLLTRAQVDAVCDAIANQRMQELRGELGIIDA